MGLPQVTPPNLDLRNELSLSAVGNLAKEYVPKL